MKIPMQMWGVRFVGLPNDVGTGATWSWDSTNKRFEASTSIISGLNPIGYFVQFTNGLAVGTVYHHIGNNKLLLSGIVTSTGDTITDIYRFNVYAIVPN
jgi:hypothetical protein